MLLPHKELLLKNISRAPSVHNAQPFTIIIKESEIEVYDDPSRILKVGDPHEHDHDISFGAFIELISVSLSVLKLRIKHLDLMKVSSGTGRLRAKIQVEEGGRGDSLSSYILKRKCFRGRFKKLSESESRESLNKLKKIPNLHILPGSLESWGKQYDDCSYSFSSNPSYMEELYSWLRLSRDHSLYNIDGLNAEALSLNGIESFFGNIFLNPSVYKWMKRLGLGKVLITEAPQIESSLAVVAITAPKNSSLIDQGRILMRAWLELTRDEIFVTPLSALSDESESRKRILSMLPENQELVIVFRAGKTHQNEIYTSPRRNLEKL